MADSALSGLKVVELGDFIAAPYCAKLMADMGAEVIKIESPGLGDSARRYGPFPNDEPNPERSLLFAYMNTSKKGITLDVRTPLGKRAFKELLKDADVLVEGNPPRVMEELGLDYDSIKDVNPELIVTSITPFGQTGPYRDYKATELVSFHTGGLGYGTPGEIEEPETHPPLKAAGHQGNVQAGITAASATMCALFARDFSGQGQHVDVSIQEPLLSAIGSDIIAHTNRRETPTRIAALALRVPGRKPFLAKDGYVTLTMVQDHFWESLKDVLGHPEWTEWEIFNERESRRDNMDALYPLVEEWTQQHTMEELYQMLQVEGHIPSSPVHSVEDVVNHPHFVERGTFVDMEHPQIGEFKSPGPAYRFSETPWQVSSPAPSLGQHNEEVLCNRLGYSKDDLARMRQMGVV
jgi:crotonobetainyl-CoA:carnitine CoA-transferase CaiB-like acyl-CoA transferase